MAASTIHQNIARAGGTLPGNQVTAGDAYVHDENMKLVRDQMSGAVQLSTGGPPSALSPVPLAHAVILWILLILAGIGAYLLLKRSDEPASAAHMVFMADRNVDQRIMSQAGAS